MLQKVKSNYTFRILLFFAINAIYTCLHSQPSSIIDKSSASLFISNQWIYNDFNVKTPSSIIFNQLKDTVKPNAEFSFSPTSGCGKTLVTFTNLSNDGSTL